MDEKEFNVRVCTSGSAGVALYIPAPIVKALGLKDEINTYLEAVMDEDGDITVYSSAVVGEEDGD